MKRCTTPPNRRWVRGPDWCCWLVCTLARAPRIVSRVLLVFAVVLVTHARGVDARGPQDAGSDRDDAAEQAARAFMHGRNPWAKPTRLGGAITTGPAAVVVSSPIIRLVGLDAMTLMFWLAVFAALLAAELRNRNESFPIAVAIYLLGYGAIAHWQHWSLDELAFPTLLFVAGVYLARRGWSVAVAVGVVLALCALWRLSYVFSAAAFAAWHVLRIAPGERRRHVARLAIGAAAATIIVFAILVLVCGTGIFAHGSFFAATRLSANGWPHSNWLFTALGALSALPHANLLRAVLALGAIAAASCGLKSYDHPYWHLTIAALVAFALAWHPGRPEDYALIVSLPVLFGISETRAAWLPRLAKSPESM